MMRVLIWLMALVLAFAWGSFIGAVVPMPWALIPGMLGGLAIGLVANAAADSVD